MISRIVEGLPIDLHWDDATSLDWRNLPDPDGEEENDEDVPTPEYVKMVLGLDPDEFNEGEGPDDLVTHGGIGSGNFGHSGRPGEVGGSGAGEGERRAKETVERVGKLFPQAVPNYIHLADAEEVTPPGGISGERYGYHNSQIGGITLAGGKGALSQEVFSSVGGAAVDSSFEGSLRHEMGHQLYSKLVALKKAEYEYLHANLPEDHYLSGVASRRGGASEIHEEHFAEAFSHYTSRDYARGDLPSPVESFFDGLSTRHGRS